VAHAAGILPYPWPRLIELTTHRRGLFTNAIYEYLPHRLVGERTVIIGDAAHVATPMTGAGLITGFEDVIALTEELDGADAAAVPDALRRYERQRLPPARDLVGYSQAWSSRFRSSH
jgi:2-polyprenyl-6-methoxyphenol hydroxylase-like FAD-dependent oxidoreductase